MELKSILTSHKVGDLALTSRPILEPNDRVSMAATRMRQDRHGSALICSDGKLVGILTERDLLGVVDGNKLEEPLANVMTADPHTITAEDSLYEVTRSMNEGGYRHLPVIDTAGNPTGIVDVKTIVHFIVEHFPEAIYNQAAHAQLIAKHREGA